jgi:glycosyltransferase involved in cell wall biosynthesis
MSDAEPPLLPPIASAPLSLLLLPGTDGDVAAIVGAWTAVLDGLNRDYEILVPEGHAPAEKPSRVRILAQTAGLGPGAVMRTGLSSARHPLLCCALADRRYVPEELKRFLERIDAVHLISGSRAGAAIPGLLRLLGKLYRGVVYLVFQVSLDPPPGWHGWRHRFEHLLYRALFGLRLHDPMCPFKLFRREVFARFPVQSEGPFVQVEMLAKTNFLGCLMDEVPVTGPPGQEPWRIIRPDLRRVLSDPKFRPVK